MTVQQILRRYPAMLVSQRAGRYVPWPGEACINEDLSPESIFGSDEPPSYHIRQACIGAERAATASQAQHRLIGPGSQSRSGPKSGITRTGSWVDIL